MKRLLAIGLPAILLVTCSSVLAASIKVPMYTTADHKFIGDVIAKDTKHGLKLIPHLHGLTPGEHGFHVHSNPSCDQAGMAAGGHLDPLHTEKHLGPKGDGHLGDLPALVVNKEGKANKSLLAPHLTTKQLHGHSLMIHAGGDNYSDKPAMGGGGARFACGIIK